MVDLSKMAEDYPESSSKIIMKKVSLYKTLGLKSRFQMQFP